MRLQTFWPFRHLGLKLLSFGLAVSLWMVVAGEETVERGLRVPLELQQFPAGLELQTEPPSAVDVRVRGASGALGRVSAGDVVAVLDLRGARAGRRLFHLTPDQVRAPFGIEVVQVAPSTIAMVFENTATRSVPVEPSIEGKPAPGYVVGRASVQPAAVDVIGPESAVKRATEALTEPVSVDGVRDRVRETVTVGVLDPALRVKGPRTATVTVPVMPAPRERVLTGIPVYLRNAAPTVAADAVPAVVTVTLRGSREGLNRVEADDVRAYVDLAGLGVGRYTLTVHADAAGDAGVTQIDPPSVQVRVAAAKK
jgi:YbbR domain-containing protein